MTATPETDKALEEKYIALGLQDYIDNEFKRNAPQDLNSLVGKWYLEGYQSIQDVSESDGNIEFALRELLDSIMASEAYRELEAGCMGDGDVVRAYNALSLRFPDELIEYFTEDEENG